MRLNRIKLNNFRNYKEADIKISKKTVVLVGNNAQGKTNLLEAIYILAITKSFRLRSDTDLIGPAENFFRIEAEFENNGKSGRLEIVIQAASRGAKQQKTIKLDGRVVPAREALGQFVAVLFCPEDINLIKTVPGGRRRFLDILGCQISPEYCQGLLEYNKIVKNRNRVLFRIKQGNGRPDELIFWNNELVEKGSRIIVLRRMMTERLNDYARKYFKSILDYPQKKKFLTLRYVPSFHLADDLEEEAIPLRFRSALLQKEKSEIERQQTVIGPHRDDMQFILGDNSIVHYGSRGEFRSAILALKLAELDFLEEKLRRPVLLFDDVFSELDPTRRVNVAHLINRQQTFITTTDLGHIDSRVKEKSQILRVQEGEVIPYR